MSELKTTSLSHKDNNTGTPNITMYPDGTTSIGLTAVGGFRNQIINGDMRIWQRGDSVVTAGGAAGTFCADRWVYETTIAGVTVEKSSDAPLGFSNSLYIANAVGSNIQQGVELFEDGNAGPFGIGTEWTYSFWSTVDPATTGNSNPFMQFRDPVMANNIDVGTLSPYRTLESSNGFTRYAFTATITNAPNPTNNNLRVLVPCPATGPIYFTGVQLEPGPVATPFEHRPPSAELAMCQRYFYAGDARHLFTRGLANPGTAVGDNIDFPSTMRVAPTIDVTYSADVSNLTFATAPVNTRASGTATTNGATATYAINANAEL